MASADNFKTPEFPIDYIHCSYKDMIPEDYDPAKPEPYDEKSTLGRHFWVKLFTWLHEEFSSGQHSGKRLLDIGSGPGITSVISASKVFDDIIITDIGEYTIQEVRKWLDEKSDAFDWTPALTFVAELEGNKMSADQMAQRVRNTVKRTIVYDIHDELPLKEDIDCITALLVLDTASTDLRDFENNLCKISKALKGPNSTVLFAVVLNVKNGYTLAGVDYPCVNISKHSVLDCLPKAGLTCVRTMEYTVPGDPSVARDRITLFVSAKKQAASLVG